MTPTTSRPRIANLEQLSRVQRLWRSRFPGAWWAWLVRGSTLFNLIYLPSFSPALFNLSSCGWPWRAWPWRATLPYPEPPPPRNPGPPPRAPRPTPSFVRPQLNHRQSDIFDDGTVLTANLEGEELLRTDVGVQRRVEDERHPGGAGGRYPPAEMHPQQVRRVSAPAGRATAPSEIPSPATARESSPSSPGSRWRSQSTTRLPPPPAIEPRFPLGAATPARRDLPPPHRRGPRSPRSARCRRSAPLR